MIITYSNIKIDKNIDKISILYDTFVQLENIDDESIMNYHCIPSFIRKAINKKIINDYYEKYSIYGLKKLQYSKIDIYKGIWELSKIYSKGEYETNYFVDDGIIYLGIKKEDNCWKNNPMLEKMIILFKKNNIIDYEKLSNIFKNNKYDFTNRMDKITLIKLILNTFPRSIIINEIYDKYNKIEIYGKEVDKIAIENDIPQKNVVETINNI